MGGRLLLLVPKARPPNIISMVRCRPQITHPTHEFELGTSISVFARVAANRNNATNLLNFVIDGTILDSEILQTNQFERFHEKVYTSPTLADGPHNMVITLNTTSGDVFLDYMIYEVSPNTPIGSSSRLLVLNTNEQLAYSLGWNSGVVLKPGLEKGAVSLNDTVQGAADLGATVALNFTGAYRFCLIHVCLKRLMLSRNGLRGAWASSHPIPQPRRRIFSRRRPSDKRRNATQRHRFHKCSIQLRVHRGDIQRSRDPLACNYASDSWGILPRLYDHRIARRILSPKSTDRGCAKASCDEVHPVCRAVIHQSHFTGDN